MKLTAIFNEIFTWTLTNNSVKRYFLIVANTFDAKFSTGCLFSCYFNISIFRCRNVEIMMTSNGRMLKC